MRFSLQFNSGCCKRRRVASCSFAKGAVPAGAFRGEEILQVSLLLLFLFVQTSMAHGVFILSLSLSPSSVC